MPGQSAGSYRPDSGASSRGFAARYAARRSARARRPRMKRERLLRHLRTNGCVLRREGKEHSLWENPQTGQAEAGPRHTEIVNLLAKRICRKLSTPEPPG